MEGRSEVVMTERQTHNVRQHCTELMGIERRTCSPIVVRETVFPHGGAGRGHSS
jgi:hypothetical protein